MDPIAHTLVGAALAQSGLKHRTALGTATLVVGANLPDVDVAAYAWGPETALWFRRGLTHGVLAVIVLPLALALAMLTWDRVVRRPRNPDVQPARFRALFLLAAIAVATHPLLDLLNVYGIRLLAPFSNRWFYGDALFIVDPWVWVLLAAGCWLARGSPRWARLALVAAAIYAVGLGASGAVARGIVAQAVRQEALVPRRVMAAPMAVTPLSRWVVVEVEGEGYRVGTLRWLPTPDLRLVPFPYDTRAVGEAMRRATRVERVQRFLSWARFPYYHVRGDGAGVRVFVADARYGVDPEESWASTSVRMPPEALQVRSVPSVNRSRVRAMGRSRARSPTPSVH